MHSSELFTWSKTNGTLCHPAYHVDVGNGDGSTICIKREARVCPGITKREIATFMVYYSEDSEQYASWKQVTSSWRSFLKATAERTCIASRSSDEGWLYDRGCSLGRSVRSQATNRFEWRIRCLNSRLTVGPASVGGIREEQGCPQRQTS